MCVSIDKTKTIMALKENFWEIIPYNDNSSIYILQNIYNHHYINNDEDESKLNIDSNDEYIDEKINTFSLYKNINENKNNYVNSTVFKKYNNTLIKTLFLGETSILKGGFFFLMNVLYILNIVAIDLKNHMFICINNNIIYIVFYFKKCYYSMNIDNALINDNINLKSSLKKFIIEYNVRQNRNYSYFSKLSFLSKIFFKSLPYNVYTDKNENEIYEILYDKHLFLSWIYDNNRYIRKQINLESNLKDLYDESEDDEYYSIDWICQNVKYFNHLIIHHKSLNYCNVVYIDFNLCIFKTLNINKNILKFQTYSFAGRTYENYEMTKFKHSFIDGYSLLQTLPLLKFT